MRWLTIILALGAAPLAVAAMGQTYEADSGLSALKTADDTRGWEAVGRIEIAGRAFCTGALVAPDLVLTAAHCLFDKDSRNGFAPKDLQFLAGWRNGRAIAYRGVREAVVHPSYRYLGPESIEGVPFDMAFLRLDQPIRLASVRPFAVGQDPEVGDRLEVVSYAVDRADAPSLQESCRLIGPQPGMNVFSCSVDFGSSGAPIFKVENGEARIVSVVSAKAELDGEAVSLGAQMAVTYDELRAALEEIGNSPRNAAGLPQIGPGVGGSGVAGAKFLKP